KEPTGVAYGDVDQRGGSLGFESRADGAKRALERVTRASDLAHLPRNDLASSQLTVELEEAGAFRADVTGAGPAAYGLFGRAEDATRAADSFVARAQLCATRPARDQLPPMA